MKKYTRKTMEVWKDQIYMILCLILGMLITGILLTTAERIKENRERIEAQYIFGKPGIKSPINIPLISTPSAKSKINITKEGKNPVVEYTKIALKYLPKYYPRVIEQSQIMPVFSCLLRNETGHGMDKSCGDGGRACGVVQFWKDTYVSYRRIMIGRGLVKHIGSRMNPEDAIETMIWAFSDGRGRAWGPFLRGECS